MKAKRSLVVGASGQVGRQLAAAMGPGNFVAAGRHGSEVPLDLAELAGRPDLAGAVLDRCAAGAVYCCGGMTDVEGCESAAAAAYLVNCFGPATLAKAAARRGLPFVYFSTEYVFDGQAGPYGETAPPAPISVYGASKREGELAIQNVHPRALILRTTVVYGPDPGGRNFLCGLRRNLLAGRTMSVAADQISTPTYNRDLAHAA
ncbi:MAG TPA: SDR family oxidoreductase, partial [Candidatus Sulfopaludibacter sp.]|nr:SDR family oxidoreductase [Candidatus Sulfopaludibacter sp.]